MQHWHGTKKSTGEPLPSSYNGIGQSCRVSQPNSSPVRRLRSRWKRIHSFLPTRYQLREAATLLLYSANRMYRMRTYLWAAIREEQRWWGMHHCAMD